jgi:hypothetical protein
MPFVLAFPWRRFVLAMRHGNRAHQSNIAILVSSVSAKHFSHAILPSSGWFYRHVVDGTTGQLFRGHSLSDALGDTVAHGLVDISPILERARQYGLAHSLLQVANDVGDQPVARRIVHDLAH